MENSGLSPLTIEAYSSDAALLLSWLSDHSISRSSLTESEAEQFLDYGTPADRTSNRRLSACRHFYEFLSCRGDVQVNPFSAISARVLSDSEISPISLSEIYALLAAPDLGDPYGFRDRVVLQLLYATGVKVSELMVVEVPDIDWDRQLLLATDSQEGKRYLPLDSDTLDLLKTYVDDMRPKVPRSSRSSYLIPGQSEAPISRQMLWQITRRYTKLALPHKKVTANSLRDAFAVHRVSNGYNPRHLMSELGYSKISDRLMRRFESSAYVDSQIERDRLARRLREVVLALINQGATPAEIRGAVELALSSSDSRLQQSDLIPISGAQ